MPRYRLSKSFHLDVIQVPGPEAPPTGKSDVDEEILEIADSALVIRLPATHPDTHNKLLEERVYLVPHDQAPPATVEEYLSSELPFTSVDVSAYHGQDATELSIPFPEVNRLAPYFGQIVQGYEE